jgi:hypothetical protein
MAFVNCAARQEKKLTKRSTPMGKKSYFLLCLWLIPFLAQAQVRIQLELPFARQMPASLSEWEHNETLIRILISNTTAYPLDQLHVAGYLEWEKGRRLASIREGHRAQPRFSLEAGETRSFSWRELINPDALDYDRSLVNRIATSGTLPEGSYQLCLYILDAKGQRIGQTEPCGQLSVILPDPPQPLSPTDGTILDPTQGLPLFRWTPTTPQLPGTTYRLVIKPVFAGQTPAQALQANPLVFLHETPATSYQYMPSDPELGQYTGAIALVWQVQALVNGQPYGRNDGLSAPAIFGLAVPEPVAALDTTTIPIDILEWEIPYENLLAGTPILLDAQLPEDAADTLFYVLRVRIPTQLSPSDTYALLNMSTEDTLSQVSYRYAGGYFLYRLPADTTQPATLVGFTTAKNWAHEVRKEISAARQIAYNAGVEGAIIVERSGLLFTGNFIPIHLLLPLQDMVLEPTEEGEPPVCGLPGLSENEPAATQARYTGYVLNQAIASGAGRPTNKTLGAVTRQAPPQGQGGQAGTVIRGRIERGRIKLNDPVDIVGLSSDDARYTGYVLNQAIASGAGRPSGKTLGAVTRQAPPSGNPLNSGQATSVEECPPNAKCAPPSGLHPDLTAFPVHDEEDGLVICWLPPVDPQQPWIGAIGHILENEIIFTWSGPRPQGTKISALVRL